VVELAEELRRQLSAVAAASASATAVRRELGRLGDDPDARRSLQQRASEHVGAVRAAEASIAAIEARWDVACRTCSATLDSSASALTTALLGPAGALSAEHGLLAVAAAGPWQDALSAARTWGSVPLGGGGARATSLTGFVAGLGPGPFTTGMAAFASDLVGSGIRQAEAARVSGLPWIPFVSDFSFTELSRSLQGGNALVYTDIFWQHLAYEHGGIEAIEAAWRDEELQQLPYSGWRSIDVGRRTGDLEAIWVGNARLLRFEQQFTLQEGVYDHHRRTFDRLSSEVTGLVAPLESPIPGDTVTFQDHHAWGDLGDFEDRWSWIDESILPAWREHEPSLQEELWQFTR
jgi:hypothetical protein